MSTTTPPPAPADWYPDPENANQERWWDGANWTDVYRSRVVASASSDSVDVDNGTHARGGRQRFVVVGAIVLAGLLIAGVTAGAQAHRQSQVPSSDDLIRAVGGDPDATGHSIRYFVTGTAREATVTMSTTSGIVQNDVDIPMMNKAGDEGVSFNASTGTPITLSAQNNGSFGSVTCSIEVDGTEISSNTSSADYGIASCQGIVP